MEAREARYALVDVARKGTMRLLRSVVKRIVDGDVRVCVEAWRGGWRSGVAMNQVQQHRAALQAAHHTLNHAAAMRLLRGAVWRMSYRRLRTHVVWWHECAAQQHGAADGKHDEEAGADGEGAEGESDDSESADGSLDSLDMLMEDDAAAQVMAEGEVVRGAAVRMLGDVLRRLLQGSVAVVVASHLA